MKKISKFTIGAIVALFAFMTPAHCGTASKHSSSEQKQSNASGKTAKPSKYSISSSKATKRRVTKGASFSKKKTASAGMSLKNRRKSAARAVKAARTFESHGVARALASTDVFLSEDLAVDKMRFNSSIVLVQDALTGDVVISKNADLRAPIASISKLMTALVTLESGEDLSDEVTITQEELASTSYSSSRLPVGSTFKRSDLMHIALMASDNRAAHALARSSVGGYDDFIAKMNKKAMELGMHDTTFEDASGLSSGNRSTANDLMKLVRAAVEHEEIRDYSTDSMALFTSSGTSRRRTLNFHTTNGLISNPHWQISLQKTGFTSAAGRCMVLYAFIDDRPYAIVMMDAGNTNQRIKDASMIQTVIQKSSSAFSAKFQSEDAAVRPDFLPQDEVLRKVSSNP